MPLFGRSHDAVETTPTSRPIGAVGAGPRGPIVSDPAVNDAPRRRSTLFRSSRRSPSPAATTTTTTTNHSTSSISPHRKSVLHRDGVGGSILHRDHEDSSITHARDRVMNAEAAEREADKALLTARAAVREARDHVKRLEREAAEEARLAKIKQKQAMAIGKRGKALGRHGDI